MAITQVRAMLGGQWYPLTYNDATRKYEAQITPAATSFHQPDGYYNVTVEAANDSGVTLTTDGTNIPGLRLVVRETTPPTFVLDSPAEGYVTTNRPTVILTATDEAGGSGIAPSSLELLVDGTPAAAEEITTEAVTSGYRFRYLPSSPLSEGRHTITASVRDNDGNAASLTAVYIVDTVPPALSVEPVRVVVDWPEIVLSGATNDATAPPVTLSVDDNGEGLGTIPVAADGSYRHVLPLFVGENFITVTATDGAGLTTQRALYVIRLITDRTQQDVANIQALLGRSDWTEAERAEFNRASARGAYNHTDLNRVTAAVEYISGQLVSRGYLDPYYPIYLAEGRTEWQGADIGNRTQTKTYVDNVSRIRDTIPLEAPEAPEDLRGLTFQEANDIEEILVSADELFDRMDKSCFMAGEIMCGEI